MKRVLAIGVATMLSVSVNAQKKKEQDVEAIKSMCGCYQVSFDYKETFASDTSYEFYDSYHTAAPAEWVFVAEESKDRILLQHLLVIQDTMIIKHWGQDWVYENSDLRLFYKDRTWRYEAADEKTVDGQWTQFVYQVDESPRYSGSATWVHYDGNHYWENTSDAPLPRREYTKRADYNVMRRTNKQMLTDYGWLHEQDNLKILRENGKDSVLVAEKGLNAYKKIDDSNCKAAQDWWKENGAFWGLVRDSWDEVLNQRNDVTLAMKVDDKLMWKKLFELGSENAQAAKDNPEQVRVKIDEVIASYLTDNPTYGKK